jgi:hypothetical protein
MLDLASILFRTILGWIDGARNQGNLNWGDCDDENQEGKMKLRSFLCCLLFIVGIAGRVYGQGGDVGSIVGTITDATGAAVANAKVLVTNTATNISKEITTNDTGNYTVPYLRPGVYRVTVEAAGFDKSVVDNISLVVAQERRVDVALRVGAVTTQVEVNAGALALDTESAAVAQIVSRTQVEELPLNGRNFLNLLFITAGAVQTVGEQGQMRQGAGNAISINGGRPESNNYTLDGLANTDTALNTPAVILSQDAIQEFKVQSETYSAEFGFSANQVNLVSRSGGNDIHGSLFYFGRNDALDATTIIPNPLPSQAAPEKAELRQNQFGFVASGPVYIPKLYDGRNKTFWLVNYEGWRIRNGTNIGATVPGSTELNGDFSGLSLPAYGTAGCNTNLSNNLPCLPVDPQTGLPFTGNKIPSTRFSKLAQVALGANIFANPTNCDSTGLCSLATRTTLPNNTNQQTYKVDQSMGRYGSLGFRYTKANYSNENAGTTSIPFGLNIFTQDSTSWAVSHTISLGQRNINTFRFGRLEATAIQGATPISDANIASLGLSGIFSTLPSYGKGFPTISFQSFSGSAGSPGNNPTSSYIPMWQFSDSLSMMRGRHTITVGFDYRNWIQKRNLSSNFLGSYNYSNNLILQNSANGSCTTPSGQCGTGNAVADFLLGYYSGAGTFQPGPFSDPKIAGNLNQFHFLYAAPYVQDDWKVTSKLTVNLGLRWDYRSIPYETHDKMFWIDRQNTAGGLCFADKALLTNGIAPAGNGFYDYCGRHNPADGSKKPFAPRVGFAFRPFGGGKTVIRGGYGIYWDSSETREIDDSGDLYPFVTRTNLSPATQTPAVAPKLTDNLYPALSALTPVTIAAQGAQFIAVIISETPRNPYVQQWSLSVQRDLGWNTTLELNYVGNKGTHLLDRSNINQPVQVTDPAFCNNPANLNSGDCPANARKPYANFSGTITLDSLWQGYSSYNAGNVTMNHHGKDLAFLSVYTWAKSLDDKSAAAGIGATNGFSGHLNDHNPAQDYGRSDFDVNHRFVNSVIYQLPFGRGKSHLSDASKAVDLAVGGWQLSAVTTFQKGFPFSPHTNDPFFLLTAFNARPNLVSGCNPNSGFTKSSTEWFNTACFSQPLAGTFGNAGRNILRGPGINNWDIAFAKTFSFTERVGLQLRVETFNSFNHTQFGVDPGSAIAASAGPGTGAVSDNFQDPTGRFGQIVEARTARQIQLGLRLTF